MSTETRSSRILRALPGLHVLRIYNPKDFRADALAGFVIVLIYFKVFLGNFLPIEVMYLKNLLINCSKNSESSFLPNLVVR